MSEHSDPTANVAPDQSVRERALAADASFIVQAPAGSGKTELLIQRFLRLLACVDEPEQVLAITFTRKAAGEMLGRVMLALQQAAEGTPPEAPHLRRSWELARAVLGDPRRVRWQLQRHPARLNIRTIDALNSWICARAPLRLTASTATETPDDLYREAARNTLHLVAESDAHGEAVRELLRHLDGDSARFERMLTLMLPRRDQWLRHAVGEPDRTACEQLLRDLAEHALRTAALRFDLATGVELASLLAEAGTRMDASSGQYDLAAWRDRSQMPAPLAGELPAWQQLAGILVTTSDTWRKQWDKRQGFPPGSEGLKRIRAVMGLLSGDDVLRDALVDIRDLPGAAYTDAQWALLRALLRVLHVAAAGLHLTFAARGQCDFPQIAADALRVLGNDEQPTDLALALDMRLQHILVDEFQDTSLPQFELLRRLIAGWEPGDGRSLFLVGDPMQSIYRFREAQVGLFMRVRDEGLGAVRPQFLQLTANFRSTPAIVAWCNEVFGRCFPAHDDAVYGAVRHAPSQAWSGQGQRESQYEGQIEGNGRVRWHWLAKEAALEPARVVETIVEAARHTPLHRICVLVRSRSHATPILELLRAAGIAFHATDMQTLAHTDVVQDLLALTRILLNVADRLAWIGVLRSPLCGLTLADLERLLGADHDSAVPTLLAQADSLGVSAHGQRAIARLDAALTRAQRVTGRLALHDLVEGLWLELGGPATLREPGELEAARSYLEQLEAMEQEEGGVEAVAFAARLVGFQSLGQDPAGVQVMTMHKAKGLEFDVVIVPGLDRGTRRDDPPLLRWHEPAGNAAAPILAACGASGRESDPLYEYLRAVDSRKQLREIQRLLYVACTRARRELHLFARLDIRPEDKRRTAKGDALACVRAPAGNSLLTHIWPAVRTEAEAAGEVLPPPSPAEATDVLWQQPLIRRLPSDWQPPDAPPAVALAGAEPLMDTPEYEWASHQAKHVGTVVHEWLLRIAEAGPASFDEVRVRAHEADFRRSLQQLGLAGDDLERAVTRVCDALLTTLSDERGRWILSTAHADARNEWPLTVAEGGRFRSLVIDRSFIADGVRWVIDYKTGSHEGGDLERFLREEQARYAPQLARYARALSGFGPEPVRTALYYPLLGAFVEMHASEASDADAVR